MTEQECDLNVLWAQIIQEEGDMVGDVDHREFTRFFDPTNDFVHHANGNNYNHSNPDLEIAMRQWAFTTNTTELPDTGDEQMDMHVAVPNTHTGSCSNLLSGQSCGQFPQYRWTQTPLQHHVPSTPMSANVQSAGYAECMGSGGQVLFDDQQVASDEITSMAKF
jgi:hypothetical protein